MDEKQFTQRQSAEYLTRVHNISLSPSSLSVLRRFGRGPDCKKIGYQVQYTQSALDEWAEDAIDRLPHLAA